MSGFFGFDISLDLGMLRILYNSLCCVMRGRVMNLVVDTMGIND
jgi:hypothetical protein